MHALEKTMLKISLNFLRRIFVAMSVRILVGDSLFRVPKKQNVENSLRYCLSLGNKSNRTNGSKRNTFPALQYSKDTKVDIDAAKDIPNRTYLRETDKRLEHIVLSRSVLSVINISILQGLMGFMCHLICIVVIIRINVTKNGVQWLIYDDVRTA